VSAAWWFLCGLVAGAVIVAVTVAWFLYVASLAGWLDGDGQEDGES
jgi:hypothetical protein